MSSSSAKSTLGAFRNRNTRTWNEPRLDRPAPCAALLPPLPLAAWGETDDQLPLPASTAEASRKQPLPCSPHLTAPLPPSLRWSRRRPPRIHTSGREREREKKKGKQNSFSPARPLARTAAHHTVYPPMILNRQWLYLCTYSPLVRPAHNYLHTYDIHRHFRSTPRHLYPPPRKIFVIGAVVRLLLPVSLSAAFQLAAALRRFAPSAYVQ